MRVGDRIDITALDGEGALALRCGEALWRGTLLDTGAPLCARARLRVLLAEDPAGSEGGVLLWLELDTPRVVQGRDGAPHQVWAGEILQVRRDQRREEPGAGRPDVSPAGVPGGVEVVIVGHGGKLEVRHQGHRYTAWAMRLPTRLDVGQELHLRLVLPLAGRPKLSESVDVLGRVLRVDGAGRMPFADGSRFELGITRHLGSALPLPTLDPAEVERRLVAWREERALALATPPPASTAAGAIDAPSGLVGNLEFLSLVEILQSLSLGQKTAQVEVTDGARTGTLYLVEGKLVAVFDADLAGEEAFFDLASWRRGSFRVHFGRSTPGENVHHSLTFLVLEQMRREDEAVRGVRVDPLSDSLAGVFKESDAPAADATDVSPIPGDDPRVAAALDFEVVEGSDAEVNRGTPVEPLRPTCARPEVCQRPLTPPPGLPVAAAGDAFASFFAEAAAQRARAVGPGPRCLEPALDDGEHPVFGGHSDSNPSPVH